MPDTLTNQKKTELGAEALHRQLEPRGLKLLPGSNRRRSSEHILVGPDEYRRLVVVRTSMAGDWQLNLAHFLDLEIDRVSGAQRVRGLLDDPDAPELYFFVRMKRLGEPSDRFFIVPRRELQEQLRRNHEAYLDKRAGHRRDTADSTHTALKVFDIEKFANRWDLATEV